MELTPTQNTAQPTQKHTNVTQKSQPTINCCNRRRTTFSPPKEDEESEKEKIARKQNIEQRALIETGQHNLSNEVTEVIKLPLNAAVYWFGAIK